MGFGTNTFATGTLRYSKDAVQGEGCLFYFSELSNLNKFTLNALKKYILRSAKFVLYNFRSQHNAQISE